MHLRYAERDASVAEPKLYQKLSALEPSQAPT
jgi:hypothetical protein